MASSIEPSRNDTGRLPAAVDALLTLGLCTLGCVVAGALLERMFGLSPLFWVRAAILAILCGVAIFHFVAIRLDAFGPANRVTSVRAFLVVMIAAFVGESVTGAQLWSIIGLAILILVLDGVDGRLARRSGQASPVGARFDLETDAALTLVLAVLCWETGKAGVWILAIGLMRYGFVAAMRFFPWIRRPLPYSRRRQTICVLQLSGLLAVVSPLFPVPLSSAVGLATLALIASSFAIDIDWLARMRPRYG